MKNFLAVLCTVICLSGMSLKAADGDDYYYYDPNTSASVIGSDSGVSVAGIATGAVIVAAVITGIVLGTQGDCHGHSH